MNRTEVGGVYLLASHLEHGVSLSPTISLLNVTDTTLSISSSRRLMYDPV